MQHVKKGDKLFVPSSYYISRGEDDLDGGEATVSGVRMDGDDYMVTFEEVPNTAYNLNYILENQDKWSKEYAGRKATPNPDVNTPWIQNGDWVNGEKWTGGDIW